MSDPAIEFRHVSLCYRLLAERGIVTLKEWMIRRLTSKMAYQELQALSDVSFTVGRGRTFGIIGHNGAGKSTLLRIAGGILAPTQGEAIIRGRLAPIIELGLGFEGELSGRENIYFNGALLGRSRLEMADRFHDIVEFSELGDFIEQPIRTYSSGMVARLAFAIATTVDAHILLLDEVMSVGDERFRTKCQQRIAEFRDAGVTILVVSHDLDAVERLCDDAMWLEHGAMKAIGPTHEVVAGYRASVEQQAEGMGVGGAVRSAES
jgi:ABC-type polysaccharide/polyol phosphate transport system ATPase subunit